MPMTRDFFNHFRQQSFTPALAEALEDLVKLLVAGGINIRQFGLKFV